MCNDAYNEIGLRAPSNAKEKHTTRVAAMPTASLCIIGRHMTTGMGIKTNDLVKTTERLVEVHSKHIKLDGIMFFKPDPGGRHD